jgi:hypothetical protein
MTEAQTQALDRIEEIMREHFTSGVLVVEGEVEENDKASDIRCTFHGGYAASIGLLELGKLQVWRKGKDVSDTTDA